MKNIPRVALQQWLSQEVRQRIARSGDLFIKLERTNLNPHMT